MASARVARTGQPGLLFLKRRRSLPAALNSAVRSFGHDDFAARLLPGIRQVGPVLGHAMEVPHSHRHQRNRNQKVLHLKALIPAQPEPFRVKFQTLR